jgi:DNA-binding transcriptional ArsR family regulator
MAQPLKSILKQKFPSQKMQSGSRWWGYVWQGLVVSKNAQHYKAMGKAIWLYLYLVIHADRKTGTLYRLTKTISENTGIPVRTIQQWLHILRKHGYIITRRTGRSIVISITKWRPINKR